MSDDSQELATGTAGLRAVRRRERHSVTKTSVHWNSLSLVKEGVRLQFTTFDAAYLERLREGDLATERHFSEYFGELIRLKLRSRVNSRDAVEDIRQETFARVLTLARAEGGIRQPERLGALVLAVCNHVLQEHYRSARRIHASVDDEGEEQMMDEKGTVTGNFEIGETSRVVRKILEDMPERDRRLLQAVVLEERDKDQVCAELGLTRDYLRVLVHRAKQSFKSYYLKQTGQEP
jgi:RNA polymerase sigma-70 factor (ECF subfamily)